MKPIKLGTLAVAAMLVLGVCSTKAAIGVTTNYSRANFSFVITTNGQYTSKTVTGGTLYKYPTATVKVGNKQLLDLAAHWAGADRTVQPWKSASLVVGWESQWDGEVLVVDNTGTNVLYDCDDGSAYFYVEFDYEDGASTETWLDTFPGYESWNETYESYFELYDDGTYLPYTYIYSYGGNAQTFKQSWDASEIGTTWSDSESAKFPFTGDEYFFDSGSETTFSGSVSAGGHGKGYNQFWY